MSRASVLLIAEEANPEWVSVPLEGWSHSQALAALADIHLVTQVRNREAILRAGWVEGRDFTAINSEALTRLSWKLGSVLRGGEGKGWTTLTASKVLGYYYFEHLVWRAFGDRIVRGEFNIVHRLTPLSPTTPSLIAARCRKAGAHFVWGPINGGVAWPKGHQRVRIREKEWLSYVRGAYKLLPYCRSTRCAASAIIVGSGDTWKQMSSTYHPRCVYVPENAVDPARFNIQVDRPIASPLRVAFAGRLVPYKGADMLVEAAAPLVREGKVCLDILGDGYEMARLRQMVQEEGIETGVKLEGRVEHTRLQDRLAESDLFGFPSLREFGGAVVLEAMMLGLVPIILDYAGPSELVTRGTGFKIPMGTRSRTVTRLRECLSRLVADPSGIRAMGIRARDRVLRHFTWLAKARQTIEVYRWVLGERPDKPDFGMPIPEDLQNVEEGLVFDQG